MGIFLGSRLAASFEDPFSYALFIHKIHDDRAKIKYFNHKKSCHWSYVNSEESEQPAHLYSLTSLLHRNLQDPYLAFVRMSVSRNDTYQTARLHRVI